MGMSVGNVPLAEIYSLCNAYANLGEVQQIVVWTHPTRRRTVEVYPSLTSGDAVNSCQNRADTGII